MQQIGWQAEGMTFIFTSVWRGPRRMLSASLAIFNQTNEICRSESTGTFPHKDVLVGGSSGM